MITGFAHTGFVVRDLASMTAFYRDVVGLAVQVEFEAKGEFFSKVLGFADPHAKVAFVGKEGATHSLELIQYVNPRGGDAHWAKNDAGATHLCFNVDDAEATYRRLSEGGARFVSPPVAAGASKVCLAQDPEGNWIEFVERAG